MKPKARQISANFSRRTYVSDLEESCLVVPLPAKKRIQFHRVPLDTRRRGRDCSAHAHWLFSRISPQACAR